MSIVTAFPRLLQAPELPPLRDDDRDQVVWLEGLAAYHRFHAGESATDPIGTHELLAARLDVLVAVLHGQAPWGIAAHDAQEGPLPAWWITEIDRRRVGRDPLRQFASLLARCILDEAALLAPYDTAAKRLVVRRLLDLAGDVEGFRAEDAWTFARDFEQAKTSAIAGMFSCGR
jgi:hypothetical protein